jgi:hypothetical protein
VLKKIPTAELRLGMYLNAFDGRGCITRTGQIPLAAVDLGHHRPYAQRRRRDAHAWQADAAGATDEKHVSHTERYALLKRAMGRQPRARAGASLGFGQRGIGKEVARMRHQHMVGKATTAVQAQRVRRHAQFLVAVLARLAGGAADPREHHATISYRDASGGGADGSHGAGDLVVEHAWRRNAMAQVQLVAVAEIEVALVQVNVAVSGARAYWQSRPEAAVHGSRLSGAPP